MDSVIVTGSGTGLGRATSLHLADKGFLVYATVPNREQAGDMEAMAREKGAHHLRVLELDITNPESIASAVATVHEENGPPFALINNAGIGLRGFFEDLADDEIRRLFDTNIFGTMSMTRAVLPYMRRARRGRIVMITSIGGKIASLGISSYCATKFAQEGLGEVLSQELRPFGIDVVIVEPAITKTERWDIHRGIARGASSPHSLYYAWFQRAEALANKMVQSTPTEPEHIASTIHHVLTTPKPRLRYMVGRRARLVYGLRRYLPEVLFERVYFGEVIRRVTRIPEGEIS
jgi:NAD(P)-dependent dehydrogenase (short-subunit alcohol dehydrogenase family)